MTVSELSEKLELAAVHPGDTGRQVSGGYVGDLLSWVIGRAGEGSAWITIMSNQNVAAVASLADVSMVILAEGTDPDPELMEKAAAQDIALYKSPLGAYELAWRLHAAARDLL